MGILQDLTEKLAQDVVDAMDEVGDDRLHEKVGKVLLDASPTTQEAYMTAVRVILAERNPRPVVARYALGPLCARAEISTRIRLADIQEVVALARMSDGGWWMGATRVIVTELACVEDG